jgi:hypothetical protein
MLTDRYGSTGVKYMFSNEAIRLLNEPKIIQHDPRQQYQVMFALKKI